MPQTTRFLAIRPIILDFARSFFLSAAQLPVVRAAPFYASSSLFASHEDETKPVGGPTLWLYLGVAAAMVLLGGAFAGLTIALMGQVRQG